MSEELKPCPFCGGEPNLTHDDYVHDDLRPMPVVECKSCSAWVRAEDWNRRAQAQAAPEADPVADPVAWVPSAVLAKLRNGSNNAPCVLTDGPAEFNDTAVYLAPQHDAELIELLERCIHRWDKLSSAFIYTTPSYKEEQAHIDELRAKLATLRHV